MCCGGLIAVVGALLACWGMLSSSTEMWFWRVACGSTSSPSNEHGFPNIETIFLEQKNYIKPQRQFPPPFTLRPLLFTQASISIPTLHDIHFDALLGISTRRLSICFSSSFLLAPAVPDASTLRSPAPYTTVLSSRTSASITLVNGASLQFFPTRQHPPNMQGKERGNKPSPRPPPSRSSPRPPL